MPSHVRLTSPRPRIGPGALAVASAVGVDACAVAVARGVAVDVRAGPESSDPQPTMRLAVTSTITALDAMPVLLADTNVPASGHSQAAPAKSTATTAAALGSTCRRVALGKTAPLWSGLRRPRAAAQLPTE